MSNKHTCVERILKEDDRVESNVCQESYCRLVSGGSLHVSMCRETRYDGRVAGRSLFTSYRVSCSGRRPGGAPIEGAPFDSLRTTDVEAAVETYNEWVDRMEGFEP